MHIIIITTNFIIIWNIEIGYVKLRYKLLCLYMIILLLYVTFININLTYNHKIYICIKNIIIVSPATATATVAWKESLLIFS